MFNFKQMLISTLAIQSVTILFLFRWSSVFSSLWGLIFAVSGMALIFIIVQLKKALNDQTSNTSFIIASLAVIVISIVFRVFWQNLSNGEFWSSAISSLFWCGISIIAAQQLKIAYAKDQSDSSYIKFAMLQVYAITAVIVLINILVACLTLFLMALFDH